MENRKNRGLGGATFIMFLVIVFMVFWFTNQAQNRQREYSYQEYQKAAQKGEIVSAVIQQNKAVPTGKAIFTMEETGSTRILYVSDVNELQKELEKYGISYELGDVPQESWLLTILLPVGISIVAFLVIFMLMNRQAGGGANAKAMNF